LTRASAKRSLYARLAPLLALTEPLLARFLRDRVVFLFAHYYPELGFDPLATERNLKFLKQHCHALPVSEALRHLALGLPVPPRAVCLIVDDAALGFYEHGWPCLKDAGIPFGLAVSPGLMRAPGQEHLLARVMQIAGRKFYLSNAEMLSLAVNWIVSRRELAPSEGQATFAWVFERVRELNRQELEVLAEALRVPDDEYMSWPQLEELKGSGLVEVVNHSMSHPKFCFVTGAWLDWELSRSSALLEERLGIQPGVFVFPYGGRCHATPEVLQALNRFGYRNAFLTEPGVASRTRHPLLTPRLNAEVSERLFQVHTCPAVSSVLYPAP
jgi:peptidoglycan/xylan/chitin deacetylase (PgdA/CDA1 family)